MKGIFLVLTVSVLVPVLTVPVAAFAATPDASFYKDAAEGGIAEVAAGRLAQDKGNSQRVKDFGAMMVKYHSAANGRLQSLAASKNMTLPTRTSVGQMATKVKLDVLSGDTFDKSYVKSRISAHREMIALFHEEMSLGRDADAKAFVAATLPTLRAHLTALIALATDMGINVK